MYGYFGTDMRQPIAGDFGLNKKFLTYLLTRTLDDSTYKYGIDMFMSAHAAGGGFKIFQASMDRKIHKPSFPKISKIFLEEATTAISIIRQYKLNSKTAELMNRVSSIDKFKSYSHNKDARSLFFEMEKKLDSLKNKFYPWLEDADYKIETIVKKKIITSEIWTEILAACIYYAISFKEVAAEHLASLLLPIFIMRSVIFWEKAENLSPEAAENCIIQQAKLFRTQILFRLTPAINEDILV
jgi:hypothetical protein